MPSPPGGVAQSLGTPESISRPSSRARDNTLILSAVVIVAFSAFVLVTLDGWEYYMTPIVVRGYAKGHWLLRPSGPAGHMFGIAGAIMMLAPVAYSLRKKLRWLRTSGNLKTWLDVHVFCGIVGPVLVTFHTSFKFNGLVSVAYWSMILVMLSGFIGRYLYVRIPRGLLGAELTRAELDARADELGREIAHAALPETLLARIQAFERRVIPSTPEAATLSGLLAGELARRRGLKRLRTEITHVRLAPELLETILQLITEHATLLRRTAYLQKTKRLFDLWHVFHMPLVYVMFLIVAAHVAFTIYLGYTPFAY